MHDVAVTGIGIVSVLGIGVKPVAQSLQEGKSGVHFDPVRQELGFRCALSGRIDNFQSCELSQKQRKTMPEFVLHAHAAAKEAVQMAGWEEGDLQSIRTGLIIGNDSTAQACAKQVQITREHKSTFPIGSRLIFHTMNSSATMNLNTIFGIRGASWTISAACASGGHAIGQARDLIALGRQDRIICGGVQEINWEALSSFDATSALSFHNDEPEKASRPFDAARDGLIPSGGAAMLALERYDLARKRKASILARIVSYAFTSDGSDLTVPSGIGLQECMKECLAAARLPAHKVDYLCAHATSTPIGDLREAEAIHAVFGHDSPWISSTKSMTGHEMWMSGSAQAVYSILMGQHGFIAPNINFSSQEADAPPLKIAAVPIEIKPRFILLNSAGFGGTNSCLLLEILK